MKLVDNIKRWWTGKMEQKQTDTERAKLLFTLRQQIEAFNYSPKKLEMLNGEMYYKGFHDIRNKQRTVIGKDGKPNPVDNLVNTRITDNQYNKLVDQKVNYVLSKPLTFNSENKDYLETLKTVFNKRFNKSIKNLGKTVLNSGIAFLFVYYNELEELKFKKLNGFEVIPNWKDSEHTELESCLRLYKEMEFNGTNYVEVDKVEFYTVDGVEYFIYKNGVLSPDPLKGKIPYIVQTTINEQTKEETKEYFNWGKLPVIPFKFNDDEIPLIRRVKSLQDAYNEILSKFNDDVKEDAGSTILILKNYSGTNLAEFRHNLSEYRAIKVESYEGVEGGVESLNIEVNPENYKIILELLKKAIIENGRGLDVKSDILGGNPNQMNIQSMYSDMDLDANEMENEFQASFEDLMFFVNMHLKVNERLDVIFDRTLLINESQTIADCQASSGILSKETIISNHPWAKDVGKELEKVKKEEQDQLEQFNNYNDQNNNDPNNLNNDNTEV